MLGESQVPRRGEAEGHAGGIGFRLEREFAAQWLVNGLTKWRTQGVETITF